MASWEISHGLEIILASLTSVSVSKLVDQKVTSYHSQMTPSWSLRPSRKEYKKRMKSAFANTFLGNLCMLFKVDE